jgi:hypothetical protein
MITNSGPQVSVNAYCFGCQHHFTKREYLPATADEDESVKDHHHCRAAEEREIGGYGATPKWCPFLPAAIKKLVAVLLEEPKP